MSNMLQLQISFDVNVSRESFEYSKQLKLAKVFLEIQLMEKDVYFGKERLQIGSNPFSAIFRCFLLIFWIDEVALMHKIT